MFFHVRVLSRTHLVCRETKCLRVLPWCVQVLSLLPCSHLLSSCARVIPSCVHVVACIHGSFDRETMRPAVPRGPVCFFFTLVTVPRRFLSIKLSDTRVYEPSLWQQSTTPSRANSITFQVPSAAGFPRIVSPISAQISLAL